MKIICTQEEKSGIIAAMLVSHECCLNEEYCKNYRSCRECVEKSIIWEVEEDGKS